MLIWYERPDTTGAKLSNYHLVPVGDATAGLAALTAAHGVRGVVRKQGEIFLWRNVRIHLDEVEGLGTFVEFEAVLGPQDTEAAARADLEMLRRELGLFSEEEEAASYADLLKL